MDRDAEAPSLALVAGLLLVLTTQAAGLLLDGDEDDIALILLIMVAMLGGVALSLARRPTRW